MVTTDTTDVIITDGDSPSASYVEWGPVIAGAVLASAISLVLFTFAGGVGLSISSPWPGSGAEADTLGVLTMAWVIIVMVFSFIAGGYIAGRLRKTMPGAGEDAVDFRDGAHGLIVWATGMLIGAALAAHVSAAAPAATTFWSAEINAADKILRSEEAVDPNERAVLAGIIAGTQPDGSLAAEDRDYAVTYIAANTDLSEQEARSRITAWEETSRESRDRTRAIGAISAFLLAASALVAAGAAYFSATLGGRHRDSNSPFPWTRARAHR